MAEELFNACEYLLDRRIAAGDGDRLPLTGPGGELTYGALLDRVQRTVDGAARGWACSPSSGC